jgi:prevent-host-death family protein
VGETLSIAQAKARFAETIRRVERGEVVILTRHGRPVARLEPLEPEGAVNGPASGEIREIESRYGSAESSLAAPPTAGRVEQRRRALERLLEGGIWPRVPSEQLGKAPDRHERDAILGYGEDGV